MASSCSSLDFALRGCCLGRPIPASTGCAFAEPRFFLVIVAPVDRICPAALPVTVHSLQVPKTSSPNSDHAIALFAITQPFHSCRDFGTAAYHEFESLPLRQFLW